MQVEPRFTGSLFFVLRTEVLYELTRVCKVLWGIMDFTRYSKDIFSECYFWEMLYVFAYACQQRRSLVPINISFPSEIAIIYLYLYLCD